MKQCKNQDAYHRQFIQIAREGFWMVDRNGCTVMVNPSLCELLGYEQENMIGRHLTDFYFPEDQQQAISNLGARELGEEKRYIVRYRRMNGSELWADISVKPIFDSDGQFEGAIALIVDVGDKLAAERELQSNRDLVQTAAEVIGIGFWDADIETRHMVWTRELEILFGYAPGTYDGSFETFYERIHPEDRGPVRAAYLRAIETQETYTFDYRVRAQDGTWHWVGARGKVIPGTGGRPNRSVGAAISIDEYKKLEEQLLQSQRLESLGHLVSCVSHDFNNFLTAICEYTELAMSSLDPDSEATIFLKNVEQAGTRAVELVKQLLMFACHQNASPQSMDLSKLTMRLRAILVSVIGDDIRLVMNVDESELLVRIDPVQYEQIIVNLAVNARDAMPEGGTLTISTGVRGTSQQEDEWVIVTVEDTGTGMDSATKERIFDPFYTTKEVGKGTGLGLSTCYGIVKNANGQIVVSSEPGRGSKFEILLPRSQSAALQDCA